MTELCLGFLAENLGLLLMTSIYCGKSSFVLVPHPLVISLSLYFGYSVASVSCFDVLAASHVGLSSQPRLKPKPPALEAKSQPRGHQSCFSLRTVLYKDINCSSGCHFVTKRETLPT